MNRVARSSFLVPSRSQDARTCPEAGRILPTHRPATLGLGRCQNGKAAKA